MDFGPCDLDLDLDPMTFIIYKLDPYPLEITVGLCA